MELPSCLPHFKKRPKASNVRHHSPLGIFLDNKISLGSQSSVPWLAVGQMVRENYSLPPLGVM